MTPHIIKARNVEFALVEACNWLKVSGVHEDSRNGPVLRAPGPVLIVYGRPRERVLFHPIRNSNPWFVFFESLWMLAGRNDVAFVEQFLPRMREFSDDGKTLNAAYGYRWRAFFGYDQLVPLIGMLQENPNSRRAVLEMWSAGHDLNSASKDLPCNTHAYFERDQQTGALNMTVCNRSNDLIWGMCGANAVHFSYLQEYIAGMLGWPVGVYVQFTNNLHLYLNRHEALMDALAIGHPSNYTYDVVQPYSLMNDPKNFNSDLYHFMCGPLDSIWDFTNMVFPDVAVPMYEAWHFWKRNSLKVALERCTDIAAEDWCLACTQWLKRAAEKAK